MLSTFVLTFVLQVPARLSHYQRCWSQGAFRGQQHRLPIRAATLVVKASFVAAWCINFGKFCAVKCAMACDMVRVESLSLSFHDYSRTVFDILSLKISASFLLFFPTLTCGVFVFSSVSAFLRRRLPPPVSHSHTHTHSLTHSLPRSLAPSLTHSLTQITHSLMHSLTHSMCILRGRRGTMCTAKGSDVRPGVLGLHLFCVAGVENVHCQGVGCTPWRPSGSASFAWQAWDNVHCQGVGCTPWRPSGSASFA